MLDYDGYKVIEVEAGTGGWRPTPMKQDPTVLTSLNTIINDLRTAIYTGGGYQASSRGEAAGSRIAAATVQALQRADNSIHGPVNQRLQRSVCDLAQKCWKQMKAFGDVPYMVDVVGDEHEYLADPYIDKTRLSDHVPTYRLVNAFGPSPELRAQEIIELSQLAGADGQPFLPTEDAKRAYPNQQLWSNRSNPRAVAQRRARTIASEIHNITDDFLAQSEEWRIEQGLTGSGMQEPWVLQAGQMVAQQVEGLYPRMRSDDLEAHIATLIEVVQDETSESVARVAAMRRLDAYYQWQAEMAAAQMPATGAVAPGQGSPRKLAAGDVGGGAVLESEAPVTTTAR